MKTLVIVCLSLLFVGCAGTRPGATLTAEQAKTIAVRLANTEAFKLYSCQPFRDGPPARFAAGHWIWTAEQGFGHGDFGAEVELAADGSTNCVDVKLFDSENYVSMRMF